MSTLGSTIVMVGPPSALSARRRLFDALEAAFPVTFQPWTPAAAGTAATIAIGDGGPGVTDAGRAPFLAVADAPSGGGTLEDVRLLDVAAVDRRVRGVVFRRQRIGPEPELDTSGEQVLGATRCGAIWTRRQGTNACHRVRAELHELGPGQMLREGLGSGGALALVALVHFLRGLCAESGWRPPPLRAAIMFDDPNLRWRSYGFIDYPRLLRHTDEHGYHAAMAMIPLDGGRAHRAAVRAFRSRPDRLSLVVHGNNHVKRELLAPADDATALALSAQALRRVARFEARHSLIVDRVMTPPHGRCSTHVARALGSLGFDALCAIHPLPWTDTPPGDSPIAGWDPADFACGCPVIPRLPLGSSSADLALRAFLDHPLILYGHHEDVASGLEPLAQAAARVNRVGAVEWTSIGQIARTNYALRQHGTTAWVRPYSGRMLIQVPEHVTALRVQAPRAGRGSLLGWSGPTGPPVSFGDALECAPGRPLEVRLRRAGEVAATAVASPSWRPWPVVRRSATELRDRARPWLGDRTPLELGTG
jgi:hypothetical protein